MNTFEIKRNELVDQFKSKIEEIQKLGNIDKLTLYTDAGVNIKNGNSACGIIIENEEKEVKIKARLPKVDLKGATTAEHLSIALGLNLINKAGLTEA